MVWACLPRFDSDPFFCKLLQAEASPSEPGHFVVELMDLVRSQQSYIPNTAILRTTLYDHHGGAIRITDFAPRYQHMGRTFTPMMLLRCIEPLSGSPRVRVSLEPAADYGARACETTYGSHHVRYIGQDVVVRLTTDVAITHILEASTFVLDRPLHLILGPDESIREAPEDAFHHHYRSTRKYWQGWSRGLSIP